MVLAWRRLYHGVVAVLMDGLPGAVLAPEDQSRSDHDLGWRRAALELHPPALDEDSVGHISPLTVRKAVSLVTTPGPGTNCAATHSQRSPTSAQPLSTPPQNPHWLTASVWEHSAFMGSGSPLATAVSASLSRSKNGRRASAACWSTMACSFPHTPHRCALGSL